MNEEQLQKYGTINEQMKTWRCGWCEKESALSIFATLGYFEGIELHFDMHRADIMGKLMELLEQCRSTSKGSLKYKTRLLECLAEYYEEVMCKFDKFMREGVKNESGKS